MTKSLTEQIMALSMPQLAHLYDNMLERKILNGIIDDQFANFMCNFILNFIGSLDESQQIEFAQEHDHILINQLLGEE